MIASRTRIEFTRSRHAEIREDESGTDLVQRDGQDGPGQGRTGTRHIGWDKIAAIGSVVGPNKEADKR